MMMMMMIIIIIVEISQLVAGVFDSLGANTFTQCYLG